MPAVELVTLIIVCATAALAFAAWRNSRHQTDVSPLLLQLGGLEKGLDRNERALHEELARGRIESSEAARQLRSEVGTRIVELSSANEIRFDSMRKSVEDRLRNIQEDNTAKLELMRQTVDEKLQGTLEQRLGESFKQVSERLEQVYRGLGEMQKLAGGVDDLKRVLANVKTRGNWGEMQLGSLLEQVLAPEQYERNVATTGTAERVDFAVRLPGRDVASSVVWLPIDAKFPQDDYQRLVDASEQANRAAMEDAGKALEARLRLEAKRIRDKYLDPPQTTDFAILFLPTEGLYAEAIRRPGLADSLQRDCKVSLAGPTTLCALLNSLQMGFRTLAIEKRSSEVWKILAAVKTEFSRFGESLSVVSKKLQEASNKIEDSAKRSRAVERTLRDVEALPETEAVMLIKPGDAGGNGEI